MFDETSFKLTNAQALLLLICIERNKDLAKGKMFDPEKVKQMWTKIVANLNAIGEEKTVDTWIEIWQLLVQYTREKDINVTDVRILNILDHEFPVDVTSSKRIGDNSTVASTSNQPQESYISIMLITKKRAVEKTMYEYS